MFEHQPRHPSST